MAARKKAKATKRKAAKKAAPKRGRVGGARPGAGRPASAFSEKDRAVVRTMSAAGITQDTIADVLECDPKTLRKHCRRELDLAEAEMLGEVAARLYQTAIKGTGREHVAACCFILKARAGWKTTTREEIDLSKQTVEALGARCDKYGEEALAAVAAELGRRKARGIQGDDTLESSDPT